MKKYKKEHLEDIIYTQLENLNAHNDYIKLLKEQNELLIKFNHKLMKEITEAKKTLKPYPVQRNK